MVVVGEEVEEVAEEVRDGDDEGVVFGVGLEVVDDEVGLEVVARDDGVEEFEDVEVFADTGVPLDEGLFDLAAVGDDPVLSRYKSAAFKMDKGQRGPYVILSRANGKFLEELFKVEVPEINEGIVEIKNIQRDPGFRAKVMVSSIDSKIDPIGTCVGMRGIRIRAVMNELSGERIDLINYSDDISTVIMNALAPAKADFVKIDSLAEKKATLHAKTAVKPKCSAGCNKLNPQTEAIKPI